MQGEINSLHKLDKHYYGLFGFMLLNEKISDELTTSEKSSVMAKKIICTVSF